MSYILEALNKMDRHKRVDPERESWVDELSAETDEGNKGRRNTGPIIVAVSIFFGLSGIIAGLIFYHGSASKEPGRSNPVIAQETVPSRSKSVKQESTPPERKPPPSTKRAPVEAIVKKPPIKNVALEEKKPPLSSSIKVNKKSLPPKENEKFKKSKPTPAPVVEASKPERVIDLTDRYKLSSTGEIRNKKYATIERRDYYVGDIFMGMLITDIGKDRVHLKARQSGQQYVIVFRYRR